MRYIKKMNVVLRKTKSFLDRRVDEYRYGEFCQIKAQTNGFLLPSVYKEIYCSSFRAEEGNMIDIGPAQGGSSIALGLGIQKSGKESKVFSIEKCKDSSALASWDDQELNVRVLKDNLRLFGVEDTNILLIGDVKDVYSHVPSDQPLSLLFIDADGALDRDFKLFYNRLIDGAEIIIDDYLDIINRFAKERYLRWDTEEQMEEYVRSKGVKQFRDLCPLGKEYTVFRFVNYFLECGLLEKRKVLGPTFFGYKPRNVVFNPDIHGQRLLKIREEIESQYYCTREQLQNGEHVN